MLWAAVLFVAVTLVAYVLFFLIPNNPARLVAGQAATTAEVKRVEHFLGTDRPIYVQYAKFLDRLVIHQNLGYSFRNRESVNSIVGNAVIPVVTMLGMDISLALGGAVFTETVYSLPGLGKTAIFGLTNNDIPIVEGVIVFATLAIIVFNLVVDLLYAWIDPRIRLTAPA